jgi:murein DD-endopeptidase MepM/ murein hydrolase activator NlpD
MPHEERRMTFIIVPHGGGDLSTRSFELSYRSLRAAAFVLLAIGVLVAWMAITYAWMSAQAARVPGLQQEIAYLEAEQQRIGQLARQLAQLERAYEQIRAMHGAAVRGDTAALFLPPAAGEILEDTVPIDTVQAMLPTAWPLTARGFVTREHLGRIPGQHPGIDVAVTEGSYIHAAGSGTVVEVGSDEVYGNFIRIEHPLGYETLYAHASKLLVTPGQTIARRQVIGLTGNTGRSTAPHLHFEIRKDGAPIDPRKLVQPPR